MNTTTRNATLTDLLGMLRDQHARKVDVVAPASQIKAVDGALVLRGTEAVLTDDGVTTADGTYVPTAVCDEGLASALNIPTAYLRRMRETRPDLYDANVNGWLHGRRALLSGVRTGTDGGPVPSGDGPVVKRPAIPGDDRSFLIRGFRGEHIGAGAALTGGQPNPSGAGIARAWLSSRYNIVDNLDVLLATLDGIRDAGVQVDVQGGDLTDRRMVVRVACPEVAAMAPTLLAGYRSPFTGATGDDNPTVFAGFQISNSETGGGAFTITPRLVVQVCNNGMTINVDAMRKVHLGGRLDDGVVRWAADTQQKALQLVTAQARDAVRTFLSADYLTGAINRLERKASTEVASADVVKVLTRQASYTQAEADGILDYFIRGGQTTVAGLVNAATAYAQTVEDGDQAHDVEARATSLLLG